MNRRTLTRWVLTAGLTAVGGTAVGQTPNPIADSLPAVQPMPMADPVPVPKSQPLPTVDCPPKPADAPKPPPTWHGHKHPVQPFAPPGAFAISPSGPGAYTLWDAIQGDQSEKPPRWPYPRFGLMQPAFAEINFSYLDPIPCEDRDWAEKLKRVPLGEHWLFSTGGDIRTRYNYETNSRLSGRDNTYQTFRGRAFADLWYEDLFRLYGEFGYGDAIWQDQPPLARDVNRGELQQLFVDVKAFEWDGNPAYVRVGRQELLYGSQRLISTNEWGETRTKFQGAKGFYRSPKLDADVFVVRPVLPHPDRFDSWDHNAVFSGAWFTHKPKAGTFIDAYYLNLDNVNTNVARGQFRSGGFNVSTFGGRYYGRFDSGLLLDFEGMFQFGHWADQSILAQSFYGYVGWHFKDVWGTPTIWAGYDYASGDPDPNRTGQRRTFNQLFQFGHYYYGFSDLVGGQNIRNWNVQAYAYPARWLTTGVQYHVFRLDSNKDALYNFAGAPLRRDPTGAAGNDVGSEIDLLANVHITDRQDLFVSYSRLFPGKFIQQTGPSFGADALYVQYSMRW